MSSELRPLSAVPFWISALLALTLGVQIAGRLASPALRGSADLPPPPRSQALRLASFGEEPAAARIGMLYVQAFDYRGDNRIPYQKLDYGRLIGWLDAILALDPRSDYPLFSAARIYAENPDPARSRQMLEYVYLRFLEDPNRRWPWLAHAALLAKHRLHDLPLALRYAQAVERYTTDPNVPSWAKQMQIFILEDMNELEAARTMIIGLLESGRIQDPAEIRFLKERLQELAARQARRR
ncbi:MAG TPA: hypothetical protein VH600_01040 [Burkholderiales bacterium]|jgi:hypothetical protein